MITGAIILLFIVVVIALWLVTATRKHQDNIDALTVEHHELRTKLADVEAEIRIVNRLRR